MEIKRDVPVGILFVVMSLFPLIYVWQTANGFWTFIGLILCMRLYDMLFDYGFAKIHGMKEDKS